MFQQQNAGQTENKAVNDQIKIKTEPSTENQKDQNKTDNNQQQGNTTDQKKVEIKKEIKDEEDVKPLGKGLGGVFNMLKREIKKEDDDEPGEPQIPGFGDPLPDQNEDPNKKMKGLGHTLQMLQGGDNEESQNNQEAQEGFPSDFPWQEKLLGKMHEILHPQEAPLQFRGRGNMQGPRGRGGRGRGGNMGNQQEEFGQEGSDEQYGQQNFGRGRGAFQRQGFEEQQEFAPQNFRGRGSRGRGGFNRQEFEEQQEFGQQNTRGRGGHQDFGRGRGGFRGQGQENDFEEQGFGQQNIRGRGGRGRAQQVARGRGQRGGRGFGRDQHQEQRWGEKDEWSEETNGTQGRTEEETTQVNTCITSE